MGRTRREAVAGRLERCRAVLDRLVTGRGGGAGRGRACSGVKWTHRGKRGEWAVGVVVVVAAAAAAGSAALYRRTAAGAAAGAAAQGGDTGLGRRTRHGRRGGGRRSHGGAHTGAVAGECVDWRRATRMPRMQAGWSSTGGVCGGLCGGGVAAWRQASLLRRACARRVPPAWPQPRMHRRLHTARGRLPGPSMQACSVPCGDGLPRVPRPCPALSPPSQPASSSPGAPTWSPDWPAHPSPAGLSGS